MDNSNWSGKSDLGLRTMACRDLWHHIF